MSKVDQMGSTSEMSPENEQEQTSSFVTTNDPQAFDEGCNESSDTNTPGHPGQQGQLGQDTFSANDVETGSPEVEDSLYETPYIPDSVYDNLPGLLKEGVKYFGNRRERDVLLTSALTVLSGCMDSVIGLYDGRRVHTNFNSLVVAPPANGKGVMAYARYYAEDYHNELIAESKVRRTEYLAELKKYNNMTKGKEGKKEMEAPIEPPYRVFFVPANTSSAMIIKLLNDSGSSCVMHETEADSLNNSLKQDWGNFSDIIRKSFHHESVSLSRKTAMEYLEIDEPRLSISLSGTINQVAGLIPNTADGLLSRFIYYFFLADRNWKDVSSEQGVDLTSHFETLGTKSLVMIHTLEKESFWVNLSKSQWKSLNRDFSETLKQSCLAYGDESASIVYRAGLVTFRIAMILTVLRRYESGTLERRMICEDIDFQNAMSLMKVYLEHVMVMVSLLPKTASDTRMVKSVSQISRFYDALPSEREFTHKEAVEIGSALNISSRNVNRHLKELLRKNFLQQLVKFGPYRKIARGTMALVS